MIATTNPRGRIFISYCSSHSDEADKIVGSLRKRGIPTWRDRSDLGNAPTPEQLEAVIADPNTGAAVMFLSRDVIGSDYVRDLEAPMLFRRAQRRDAFFLVPIVCDGMSFEEADNLLDGHIGLPQLRNWNAERSAENSLTVEDVERIGSSVLRKRIKAIHDLLPADDPIPIRVDTRGTAGFDPSLALWIDLTPHTAGRIFRQAAWDTQVAPLIQELREAISVYASGRTILLNGLAAIPLGIALGAIFSTTRGISADWLQPTQGKQPEVWSLDSAASEVGIGVRYTTQDPGATDISLLMSVVDDVVAPFARSRRTLPRIGTLIDVTVTGYPTLDAGAARSCADRIFEALREARRRTGVVGTLHIFGAMPIGLAMLVGRRLNTFGEVQTYEYIAGEPVPYQPSIRFHVDS